MTGGCAVQGKAGLQAAFTRMLPKETLLKGRFGGETIWSFTSFSVMNLHF